VLYLALLLLGVQVKQDRDHLAGSILAVEEPEAHLHPHVQRVLFAYLLRSTAVIVTTHSAQIASVTNLESIVLLKRERDETTALRAVSPVMTPQQRQDLERYLDVNRADILFSRGVILVEGPAEQYVVPAVASDCEFSLDHFGVTVCSVDGTDFTPYVLLLRSLEIPHVVVTDGDPNSEGTLVGITRGIRLVEDASVEGVVEPDDPGLEVDTSEIERLAASGVFVSHSTLEIEYAKVAGAALQATYEDLTASKVKRARFQAELASAGVGDREADKRLVNRIEGVGKGRFAQRLVAHLNGHEHPPYIVQAIDYLRARISE
jgi:putative ATP-dependent endonuclease of OLD family